MASFAANRLSQACTPVAVIPRLLRYGVWACMAAAPLAAFPAQAQDLQDLGSRARAKVEQDLETRVAPKRYRSQAEERSIPAARLRAAEAGLQAMRQQTFPEKIELTDRQGSFAIGVSCPAGYVESVEYNFSIEGMEVRRAHGQDCDTPEQCRSWVMNAYPPNESVSYDVTIALSCDADEQAQARKAVPESLAERGAGSAGNGGQGQ